MYMCDSVRVCVLGESVCRVYTNYIVTMATIIHSTH